MGTVVAEQCDKVEGRTIRIVVCTFGETIEIATAESEGIVLVALFPKLDQHLKTV